MASLTLALFVMSHFLITLLAWAEKTTEEREKSLQSVVKTKLTRALEQGPSGLHFGQSSKQVGGGGGLKKRSGGGGVPLLFHSPVGKANGSTSCLDAFNSFFVQNLASFKPTPNKVIEKLPGNESARQSWKFFFNAGQEESDGYEGCYQDHPSDLRQMGSGPCAQVFYGKECEFFPEFPVGLRIYPACCDKGIFLSTPTMAGEYEYRLTKYLMSNYDRSVRPIENSSAPVHVKHDVSIHQIIDVDEKNQILTTNCWITTVWNDSHLTWNISDFGNISTIRLPFEKVWRPDIILYNNADSNYNNAIINTNVMVSFNGEINWLSHGIFRSSCDISVEYFPFDVQVCKLKWASWTYDGTSLNLSIINNTGDVSNYQPNGEFEMEVFRPERHVVYYSCCKEPYIDITYSIQLRRRPMFYVFNLILPCILINGIALLVFYVPSESGEKVTLGISALLSMTVFLMTIRESLPPTEKTPLISLYYGVSICLVSFASAMAVVTLNIHHRGVRGNEVPEVVKKIVLDVLSKLVFLHFDSSINIRKKEAQSVQVNGIQPTNADVMASMARMPNTGDLDDDSFGMATMSRSTDHHRMRSEHEPPKKSNCNGALKGGRQPTTAELLDEMWRQNSVATSPPLHLNSVDDRIIDPYLDRVLAKVSSTIDRNELRNTESDARDKYALEWKQVSLVLDRILLLVFFLAMTVTSFVILTSSPHLYSFIDMVEREKQDQHQGH